MRRKELLKNGTARPVKLLLNIARPKVFASPFVTASFAMVDVPSNQRGEVHSTLHSKLQSFQPFYKYLLLSWLQFDGIFRVIYMLSARSPHIEYLV